MEGDPLVAAEAHHLGVHRRQPVPRHLRKQVVLHLPPRAHKHALSLLQPQDMMLNLDCVGHRPTAKPKGASERPGTGDRRRSSPPPPAAGPTAPGLPPRCASSTPAPQRRGPAAVRKSFANARRKDALHLKPQTFQEHPCPAVIPCTSREQSPPPCLLLGWKVT